MAGAVHIKVNRRELERDARRLEKKLAKLSKTAVPRAEARALNTTAARARTQVARKVAQAKRVPVKVVRGRVRVFKASARKPVRTAVLWLGLKVSILVENLPGARLVQQGKHAGSLRAGRITTKPFTARMPNGKRLLVVRVTPGQRRTRGRPATSSPNLPIERPQIRLMPEAQPILEDEARQAMRTIFPKEYRRLLTASVNKLRGR